MLCSTGGIAVDERAVNEGRKALVDGGPVQFKDGAYFSPLPELLGYLQAAADFGATCTRITAVPNVLAYLIAMGPETAPYYVVQYPKYDDPTTEDYDVDPVGFALVSFPAGAWPCIKCQVTDGGTLKIWPYEVSVREDWDDEGPSYEVCMVHGTVERLSRPDDDEDLYEDHAPWCDGSCEGACSS